MEPYSLTIGFLSGVVVVFLANWLIKLWRGQA